ncbi:hypothetical protein SAMN05421767_1511 [Granulicatella balaenopterae]|uniref:Uncharacterized protein n=1 Tax=Granulicatella balaenopterae TaxID=137733 RepID=A0A1H9P5Q4_9LACT|nr:hypothetical protein [Granulicatella balaenopterae]SER43576.1 hypothetical protein SAMN05421767_1511 [Granulicatella balaenopterae]
MEQPLHTISSFIQPFLHTFSQTLLEEDYSDKKIEFMPLFDVIQCIHEAYYFTQTILLQFEVLTPKGYITTHQLTGMIKTPIQDNNYFVFEEAHSNLSHLISLEQVLQIVKLS